MHVFRSGVPADNAFIDNHVELFVPAALAILMGSGLLRARVVAADLVSNQGPGTIRER
jgi:hypothetical protein